MTRHSELQFESEGRTLRAYLAWPEMTTGAAPGVLVLHEAFGLNDDIRRVTDRLAQAGYVALAADLFSGQNRALCMARLMGGLFLDSLDHQGVRDTRRALDVLAALPGVDAGRLGAVGFCLGGSLALATACTDGLSPRITVSTPVPWRRCAAVARSSAATPSAIPPPARAGSWRPS